MFREVADIKTADQLHLPTPNAHYETVVVQPSAIQKRMVQELSKRAAKIHGGAVDPHIDNMLKVSMDGKKLGLDQRLINSMLPDDKKLMNLDITKETVKIQVTYIAFDNGEVISPKNFVE